MPSNSPKQHRFMQAIAHSPSFAAKAGVATSVGKDFVAADKKAHKFADGGMVKIQAGNEQLRLPGPTVMGGGKGKIVTGSPFRPRWGEQARPFADGGSANPMQWPQGDEAFAAPPQDEGAPEWLKAASGAMLTPQDTQHIPMIAGGMATGAVAGAVGDTGDALKSMFGHSPVPTFGETTRLLHKVPGVNMLASHDPDEWQGAFQAGQYVPILPAKTIGNGLKAVAKFAAPAGRAAADLANTDVGALFSKLKPAATAAYDTATAVPSHLPVTQAADATMGDFLAARRAAPTGGLGSALTNNGSNESAASAEAIGRLEGEQGQNHYMVHRSGSATSMPGTVDRVDQFPPNDHIRIQEHPGGAIQVHSTGSNITQDDIPGILARFKQSQNLPRLFGGQ